MKIISKYLVLVFILFFGIIGIVGAVEFPKTISAGLNSDYSCSLGGDGRHLCAKEYSASSASGKAFCTLFKNEVPYGSCTLANPSWSNNSEVENRVSATIGAIIKAARDSKANISWDNYYYAELAINKILYYGYSENRGYGSKLNNVDLLISRGLKDSSFNKAKYDTYISAANFAYFNYGKIKISISSMSYNPATGEAKAKVVCSGDKGKVDCKLNQIKFAVSGGNTVDGTASGDYVSANVGNVADGANITLNVNDHHVWYKAKNYNCGSGYQSLTPNYLDEEAKDVPKSASIVYNSNKYNLNITKTEVNSDAPLGGVVIKILKGGLEGEVYQNNIELSDGVYNLGNLDEGKYCVVEIQSPEGYVATQATDEKNCVTIGPNNIYGDIKIENERVKKNLTINKVDEKGNYVKGAKISIYSYDNIDISSIEEGADLSSSVPPIETFVTDGENPHVIQNLEVGKTYTVVEEEFPAGYSVVKSSQEITISSNDAENVVTLVNTHTTIKVSKQSITSSKELPGAKLTITDAQGNVVQSWTSTDKPQEIEGLSDGDYTLTETTAPQGYTVAESIKFTIENGVVKGDDDNMVVMKDATIVDVDDTFNIQNIITMIAGVVLVGLGTGVLFYETKKKKA